MAASKQHDAVDAQSARAAKWFSPIQPVTNGTSDSQNSRCRLAHRTPPLTWRAAWSRWWWLFQ